MRMQLITCGEKERVIEREGGGEGEERERQRERERDRIDEALVNWDPLRLSLVQHCSHVGENVGVPVLPDKCAN